MRLKKSKQKKYIKKNRSNKKKHRNQRRNSKFKQNGGNIFADFNENCTIFIKTFLRPKCVEKCIENIRKYYKDIPIIVVDDSYVPLHEDRWENDNIIWYTLQADSGCPVGRNYGLSKIKTKYFFYLDDDHLINENTDLLLMYKLIEKSNFDILGGTVNNSDYIGTFDVKNNMITINDNIKKHINVSNIDLGIVDRVHNFYIANTSILRQCPGWYKNIKTQEHTLFFLEIFLNNPEVKIATIKSNKVDIKNVKSCAGEEYDNFRNRKYDEIVDNYILSKYNLKYKKS